MYYDDTTKSIQGIYNNFLPILHDKFLFGNCEYQTREIQNSHSADLAEKYFEHYFNILSKYIDHLPARPRGNHPKV